jgi:glycosyltransferase involved in cell wall biosynthesis
MKELGVSVYCTVYNHEKYLRQCLDSLLHQETDFRYSIIVHDDASTDDSAAIVREYAELYPDIIIPICQEENQTRRCNVVASFIEPLVTGKYVAICEGDDYWCRTDKLQKQFDVMERNPECALCLHRTIEVNEGGEETGREYPLRVFDTGFVDATELIDTIDDRRLFHTSSFFMRASVWHDYMLNPPSYKRIFPVGDVPIILYFGSRYQVYQINEAMSCYRRGSPNSWSSMVRYQNNWDVLAKHHERMFKALRLFDNENMQFHDIMLPPVSNQLYANCVLTGKMRLFFKKENIPYFHYLPLLKKLSVVCGVIFPSLLKKVYVDHLLRFFGEERSFW